MDTYEKKYKNALEWAKQVMNGETGFIRKEVEEVFPELKESEDERIKEEIKELIIIPTWKTESEFHRRRELVAWLEKQGEKILANSCKTCKDAWSEEDEHRVKDTIYFLDTAKKHYASTVELNACIDWLKSLRPQKQQEWTQADKNFMDAAIAFVQQNKSFNCWGGVNKEGVIAFLQSLRPQKQWKPSEEQLTELRCVISGCSYETNVLMELEKQLNSLL